jgi:hypothetical protein
MFVRFILGRDGLYVALATMRHRQQWIATPPVPNREPS